MSGSEHPIEWYLARDDQQFGPLSDVELKKFVELGHLRATDLLWRHGFSDWRPAASVFAEQRAAAAAPAAQMPQQHRPQQPRQHQPARTEAAEGSRAPTDPWEAAAAAAGDAASAQGPRSRPVTKATAPLPAANSAGGARPQRTGPAAPVKGKAAAARSRDAVARRRRFPWVSVIVCLLLAMLAGTALALHRSGKLSGLMADFGLGEVSNASSSEARTVTGSTANGPARPRASGAISQDQDGLKISPLQGFGNSKEDIDAGFQRTALWRLIKQEFPDWYAERVQQAAMLKSEQKDDKAIAQALVEALVALRRKHVAEALSASPSRLRLLASAFLDNLGRLAGTSIEACYGFISQGETSPMVVELARSSEHTPHLQAQAVAVFEAIVEGRKSPRAPATPRREDYDALAGQLGKRGWSPADLQLFSDARALARAAPQKVCQMVQDWFAAQLAVKDEEVQLRLLVEALKPVVAG